MNLEQVLEAILLILPVEWSRLASATVTRSHLSSHSWFPAETERDIEEKCPASIAREVSDYDNDLLLIC